MTAPATPSDTEIELFTVAGHDGYLRGVNQSFAHLLGLSVADVEGRSILELVHPADLQDLAIALADLEAGAREVMLESRFLQHGGQCVHLQWVARPVPDSTLWWAAGRDTSQFHQLLAERVDLRARLALAVGSNTAAMWDLDVRAGRLTWEDHAVSILGSETATPPPDVPALVAEVHPDDRVLITAAFDTLSASGVTEVVVRAGHGLDARHLSLRGRVLERDRRGRAIRAVGILLDITSEKAMEEQMLRMVTLDALTGVPNRRAFDQSLRNEWRRAKRSGEPVSVLMVDIDDFKAFNDDFGHLVGDEALCAVARALVTAVGRGGDVLARFGGEEFAAVLPTTDHLGAMRVASRMLDAVRAVAVRQAPGRDVTVSVGTATWHPEDTAMTTATMLARADKALYAAKRDGKDRAVGYERSLAAHDQLEAVIAGGLAGGEFELYYQPVIELAGGRVVGFEALARWNRPGHGLVPPGDFIPVLEASTLICDLGRWALHEAAAQLRTWSHGDSPVADGRRVAVNISGRHVVDPVLLDDVAAALAATGIEPQQLDVEMTETALVVDGRADQQLARLRALGVTVAIDDFGTGYTSVGQLPHLPVDTLKIDRSFIDTTDPGKRELVKLMVGAAHAFGLRVIAEGVEDDETLAFLTGIGCDRAQGYHFAKPMPARDVSAWLSAWDAERSAPARLGLPAQAAGQAQAAAC